jgi:hypothetical protein
MKIHKKAGNQKIGWTRLIDRSINIMKHSKLPHAGMSQIRSKGSTVFNASVSQPSLLDSPS